MFVLHVCCIDVCSLRQAQFQRQTTTLHNIISEVVIVIITIIMPSSHTPPTIMFQVHTFSQSRLSHFKLSCVYDCVNWFSATHCACSFSYPNRLKEQFKYAAEDCRSSQDKLSVKSVNWSTIDLFSAFYFWS